MCLMQRKHFHRLRSVQLTACTKCVAAITICVVQHRVATIVKNVIRTRIATNIDRSDNNAIRQHSCCTGGGYG